jgi:hypothetical protein
MDIPRPAAPSTWGSTPGADRAAPVRHPRVTWGYPDPRRLYEGCVFQDGDSCRRSARDRLDRGLCRWRQRESTQWLEQRRFDGAGPAVGRQRVGYKHERDQWYERGDGWRHGFRYFRNVGHFGDDGHHGDVGQHGWRDLRVEPQRNDGRRHGHEPQWHLARHVALLAHRHQPLARAPQDTRNVRVAPGGIRPAGRARLARPLTPPGHPCPCPGYRGLTPSRGGLHGG